MTLIKKTFKFCKKLLFASKDRVPEFYKTHSIKLQRAIVDNGLAISKEYGYIYCRIRKSANSTVIATLYNIETRNRIDSLTAIQKIKDNYFTRPSVLSKSEVKQLDEYYKFTIVRNPYHRLWSAYLDKILPSEAVQRKMVIDELKIAANKAISFDDFLTFLETGGLRRNSHWAPQTEFLVFPIESYNYIGKIESFKEDLENIMFAIFKTRDVEVISIREHKTSSKNRAISMTENQKQRVYKLYKEDFIQLKYSKDLN
jgi:hypothetical protein